MFSSYPTNEYKAYRVLALVGALLEGACTETHQQSRPYWHWLRPRDSYSTLDTKFNAKLSQSLASTLKWKLLIFATATAI